MSSSHSQRSVPGRREEPWSHSEGCPAGILGRVQRNVHREFPAQIQGKGGFSGPCGRKKGSTLIVVTGRESERLSWKKAGGASLSLF